MSLRSRIPDAQVVISLSPEELASQLLGALPVRPNVNQGMFNRDCIARFAGEFPHHQDDVELAITEAPTIRQRDRRPQVGTRSGSSAKAENISFP